MGERVEDLCMCGHTDRDHLYEHLGVSKKKNVCNICKCQKYVHTETYNYNRHRAI